MGIRETGAIYKGFIFNGEDSKDYGVYITGEPVYNAPERDVEIITIPGRNGAFVRDNGRFENITVSYPAGMFGDEQTDFAEGIMNFRNALASKKSYCRLTDDYNTDEYRMAVYKSGLDVSPSNMGRAGQFNITFECKPQRFLTSGETATSKANNSTITNPTLFDARPLLQFKSNGSTGQINLGAQRINVLSAIIGLTSLDLTAAAGSASGYSPVDTVTINNTSVYNTNDEITFNGGSAVFEFVTNASMVYPPEMTNSNGVTGTVKRIGNKRGSATVNMPELNFTAGTSSTYNGSIDLVIKWSPSSTATGTINLQVVYNGSNTITVKWAAPTITNVAYQSKTSTANYSGSVNSSKNALQNVDIYIDLDIGEAYSIDSSNNVVSLNNYVNLGSELPVLAPGSTTITYTNITNFKITPRWWRV